MKNRIRDYWNDDEKAMETPPFAPVNRIYRSAGDKANAAHVPMFWGNEDPHERQVLMILRSIEMVWTSVEQCAPVGRIWLDRMRVFKRLQGLLDECEELRDARSQEVKRIVNGLHVTEQSTREEIVSALSERTLRKLHMDLQQRVLL